jgi:hypothetical protein
LLPGVYPEQGELEELSEKAIMKIGSWDVPMLIIHMVLCYERRRHLYGIIKND